MISNKAEDMVREAKAYKKKYSLGDNYFVKIPVSQEGYRAMPMLKDAGFNVTATAIFTQQQALVARPGRCRLGCTVCKSSRQYFIAWN